MSSAVWKWGVVAAALCLAAPQPARADGSWPGSYTLIGGGVMGFNDSTAKDAWNTGGTWDLRFGGGLRTYVGGEVAYVGSYNTAKVGNLDLLGNGAEAVLRLQAPVTSGAFVVEPFAFGGIGWRYLSVRNAPAGVKDSDNIGTIPFGAGVTVGTGRLLLDARFTYRPTFNEDLGGPGGTIKMSNWAVNAAIGFTY